MIKYEATITGIGPLLSEFTQAGVLVFFGPDAPEELREFAVIHDGKNLQSPVTVDDWISLGEEKFRVLAIGEIANQNLANLGHFIVKFNGETQPEMPGDICAEARPLPEITVGMRLQIVSPE